jgi:hypothetical protein
MSLRFLKSFSQIILVAALFAPVVSSAADTCADTQAKFTALLGGKDISPKWIETTASDGKPLKILISTKDNRLYFVFEKTQEGVWAEGRAIICKDGKDFVVNIDGKDIKLGSSAPLPIRLGMGSGAKFHLQISAANKMHVSTFGWSGDFIPGDQLPKH